MAKRQRDWGRRTITRIRLILGGRCCRCGADQRLELDCIVPQGHRHHAAGIAQRASFYRRMLRAGNLQLLCSTCHTRKTALDMGITLTSSVKEIEEPY